MKSTSTNYHYNRGVGGKQQNQSSSEPSKVSNNLKSPNNENTQKLTKLEPIVSHVEEMERGNNNILVCVRVRPESNNEKIQANRKNSIVKVIDDNMLVFDPSSDRTTFNSTLSKTTVNKGKQPAGKVEKVHHIGVRFGRDMKFAFDRVFDENASQIELFENTTKFLLPGVLNGFNATVFAYGPTGSGKTHTMIGNERSGHGVLILTVIQLFYLMESQRNEKQFKLSVSYLEVYNEQIHDLLSETTQNLELREDKDKQVVVSNLSVHYPVSVESVMDLLNKGNQKRIQFETDANSESSRSHAVFQLTIEQTDRTAHVKANVKIGKLSLIDLAGSERAAKTNNRGVRLTEGANINRSLLALGNCINALANSTSAKPLFVPYRDSKLTRILKDSLGGNCRTVMIATVSPSFTSYEDTLNTLKYADRAKQIKTKAIRNEVNVDFHLSKYTKIIDDLRNEVNELKRKLKDQDSQQKSGTANIMAVGVNADVDPEKEQVSELHKKLMSNFQEQLRLRKQIIEIEDKLRKNSLDILKKSSEISQWELEHPKEHQNPPVKIHTLRRDISEFLLSSTELASERQPLELQLNINLTAGGKLQEAVSRIKNLDLVSPLLYETRLHDQIISNLELEREIKHRLVKEQRFNLVFEQSQQSLALLRQHLMEVSSLLSPGSLLGETGSSQSSVLEEVNLQFLGILSLCDTLDDKMSLHIPDGDQVIQKSLETPQKLQRANSFSGSSASLSNNHHVNPNGVEQQQQQKNKISGGNRFPTIISIDNEVVTDDLSLNGVTALKNFQQQNEDGSNSTYPGDKMILDFDICRNNNNNNNNNSNSRICNINQSLSSINATSLNENKTTAAGINNDSNCGKSTRKVSVTQKGEILDILRKRKEQQQQQPQPPPPQQQQTKLKRLDDISIISTNSTTGGGGELSGLQRQQQTSSTTLPRYMSSTASAINRLQSSVDPTTNNFKPSKKSITSPPIGIVLSTISNNSKEKENNPKQPSILPANIKRIK